MDFVEHANRPQSVVSNWETGKQTPTLETLAALEASLGLPLGTLAARAGYFTAEAAVAACPPGVPISSLSFESRADAFRAVRSADGLGLGVRLVRVRSSDGSSRWLVDVLPADRSLGGE
jgi:transcriptional regulator with XRE-family HTH domain